MTITELNLLNPLIMQDTDNGRDKDEKEEGLELDEEKEDEEEDKEDCGDEKEYLE